MSGAGGCNELLGYHLNRHIAVDLLETVAGCRIAFVIRGFLQMVMLNNMLLGHFTPQPQCCFVPTYRSDCLLPMLLLLQGLLRFISYIKLLTAAAAAAAAVTRRAGCSCFPDYRSNSH
jgi:hypothetical protein